MRTKLAIAVVLTVVCLLPVAAGASNAQQDDPNKTHLDYKVYLPLVAKPPCTPTRATAYVATSKPVVRVGEIMTVTGAIVNECSLVGIPGFRVFAEPSGILTPSLAMRGGYPSSVPIDGYEEVTFTLQAVGTGVVTVTVTVTYETVNYNFDPPVLYFDIVGSSPTVVRVLPKP